MRCNNQSLSVVMIGLGKQAQKYHLPAITCSSRFTLVAVCDTDHEATEYIRGKYNVPGYTNLDELIDKKNFEVAVVSIPHCAYLSVIDTLSTAGKHIIKEKPFATNLDEARKILQIVNKSNIYLGVTLPRRFEPTYRKFHDLSQAIGTVYSTEGAYTMNIAALDKGWRASERLAGGGALVDMGYHSVDLLLWYFGLPTSVTARTTLGNRPGQQYDVEDTVYLLFDYELGDPDHKLLGNFVISRVREKQEYLRAFGTKGMLEVSRRVIRRLDIDGNEIERLESENNSPSTAVKQAVKQLEYFANKIHRFTPQTSVDYTEHLQRVAFIEAAYESDRLQTSCNPMEHLETIQEIKRGV